MFPFPVPGRKFPTFSFRREGPPVMAGCIRNSNLCGARLSMDRFSRPLCFFALAAFSDSLYFGFVIHSIILFQFGQLDASRFFPASEHSAGLLPAKSGCRRTFRTAKDVGKSIADSCVS
jgi:hypothetical protein